MYISSVALDEFWVDTTLLSLLTFLPKLQLRLPRLNLGSDAFICIFSVELHSCLNILYTSNFTMKGSVTFQGLAFCQA